MLAWFRAQLGTVETTPYEMDQKRRMLATFLWMQLALAFLIGLVNLPVRTLVESIAIFATGAAALPALLLNKRGHYELAGGIAALAVVVAIDVSLYEAGGIHDVSVVTFPLFVNFGTLLFSRRSLPLFLVLSLGSIIALGSVELVRGDPAQFATNLADIIIICLLTVGSAVLVWVTVGNLEEYLRRARRSERDMREAYDRTLEGWSRALEYRDSETHGHSRRVVNLCMRLAQEWGFGDEELTHIHRGALLHDIGKMAIPDRILLKRGPLTSGEWKVMKQHPAVACRLLSDIPYLGPALSIPASHHERWDGTGYPKGSKGPLIPMQARIFAVVDQYDALSSDRPYRKAWSRSKALDYIRENAGRIFDPEVCAVFLRLHQAKAFGPDA